MATDKRLLRLAREQRVNNVNAEAMLWRIVRDRRCAGHKFRRQMPLGDYIVDFVCPGQRLVVKSMGLRMPLTSSAGAIESATHGWRQMTSAFCA